MPIPPWRDSMTSRSLLSKIRLDILDNRLSAINKYMARILLVEDDPLIAEIYVKKFEASGFEVVNVASGKAVLTTLEHDPKFDLVLLDLVLPEMGGMEVLKELRTDAKYPADLKIIIFSNLSDPENRKRAVELKVNGFIQKTEYTPSRLVEEVSRLIGQFDEQKRNGARSEQEKDAPTNNGKRILFIEDEPIFIDMFGRRLMQEGYGIVSKMDGMAAVEAAENEPFDLIITDAMLPGMTGKEIIERLKSGEKTKHIPIFLLSASLEETDMEELSKSTDVFKAFLKTQITPTELTREVNQLFGEK
jgi:CheY-like chemotaxis protein